MRSPIETTGTFPEFNEAVNVTVEENLKIWKNSSWQDLIWMCQRIKDFIGYMNGIGDNDDIWNVVEV